MLRDNRTGYRHIGDQQRKLAGLAQPKTQVPGQGALLADPLEQEAINHRFQAQYQRRQHQGRCQDLVEQREVKARANREKEQYQEKIPQWFQVDRDVLGYRAGSDRDAGDEGAYFRGQAQQLRTLREAQAPADGQQEDVLVEAVKAGDQRQ